MPQINPHIIFNGNAEEAFNFYKAAFGGEFTKIIRFKDLPADPNNKLSEEEANKIMHIILSFAKGGQLSGNDVPQVLGKVNENENRSKISVTADSKEEADHLFNNLSAGGQVEFPMSVSPWGPYFGMFRDKYGIEWTIEFNSNL